MACCAPGCRPRAVIDRDAADKLERNELPSAVAPGATARRRGGEPAPASTVAPAGVPLPAGEGVVEGPPLGDGITEHPLPAYGACEVILDFFRALGAAPLARGPKRDSIRRDSQLGQLPNMLPHPLDERVDVCYGETAEHIAMRQQLREQLRKEGIFKNWLENNHALMRFMRARNFHFEKTLLMLRNCLAWRRANDVDNVLERFTFSERVAVKRHYPYSHHRTDKFGRVLYFERVGRSDFDAVLKTTSMDRMLRAFAFDAELTATWRLPGASRAVGHPVDKIFTVLDLDGFNLVQFDQRAREYLKAISSMASDYYPEQLGMMFIINCPLAFRVVWSFMKPILDIKTAQKIKLFSVSERAAMQKELHLYVSAENLPVEYGGEDRTLDFQTEHGPWVDAEWTRRFA